MRTEVTRGMYCPAWRREYAAPANNWSETPTDDDALPVHAVRTFLRWRGLGLDLPSGNSPTGNDLFSISLGRGADHPPGRRVERMSLTWGAHLTSYRPS